MKNCLFYDSLEVMTQNPSVAKCPIMTYILSLSVIVNNSHCMTFAAKDGYSNNNLIKPPRKMILDEQFSEPYILRDHLPPNDKIYIVNKGNPVLHLKCESKGNPKPKITWYKVSVNSYIRNESSWSVP